MRQTDSEHLRDIGLEKTNGSEDDECEDEDEDEDEEIEEVRPSKHYRSLTSILQPCTFFVGRNSYPALTRILNPTPVVKEVDSEQHCNEKVHYRSLASVLQPCTFFVGSNSYLT